ncbi:MAG: WD40 repeat domain-containing protein [Kofleriaceae bacterium]
MRELAMRWIHKHRTAVAVGAVAVVALAVVAVLAFINIDDSRDNERRARELAESSRQRSEEQRARAENNVAALLEEQGRTELLGGDRTRALTYLAAAYARGRDTPALRYLLAAASRGLDLLVHSFPNDADAVGMLGGDRSVTIERNSIVVRDGATEVKSHALDLSVHSATFEATGRLALITGSSEDSTDEYDRWFGVWDVETGARRWRTDDPEFLDARRVISPDGKLLASYYARDPKHPLVIRDLETGAMIGKLPGKVTAVAFTADHELFAVCPNDREVLEVWATAKPTRPIHTLRLDDGCMDVAFAGRRVVFATANSEIAFWNLGEPRPIRKNAGHAFLITTIAVSPDQERVATGDYTGIVRLWSAAGDPLGEARDVQGSIDRLQFTRDGSSLVGSGAENRVFVWATSPMSLRHAIEGRNTYPTFAIDPGGKRLATLTDQKPRVWRFPAGNQIVRVPAATAVIAGTRWLTADRERITVLDLQTGAQTRTIEHDAGKDAKGEAYFWWIGDLRASPSGTFASYTSMNNGESFDPTRDNPAVAYPIAAATFSSISDDGRYLIRPEDKHVRISTGDTLVRDLDLGEKVAECALSPDGDRVVVGMFGKVKQLRVSTGETLAAPVLPEGTYPYTPRFDPTGKTYALYSGDQPVLLIDAASGALLATFPTVTKAEGVAFSSDGTRIAIGGTSTVEVWDSTGTHRFSVTSTIKNAYVLGNAGELVATGSADGSIRLWDGSGRLLDRFVGHSKEIKLLQLAAGRLLALGNDDYATLWDVHLDRRTPAEVTAFADRHSSWKLVGVQLVQK